MPPRHDAAAVVVTSKRDVRKALAKRKNRKLKRPRSAAASDAIMAGYLRALVARFRNIVEAGVKNKLLPWLRSRTDSMNAYTFVRADANDAEQLGRIIRDIRLAWGDVKAINRISADIAAQINEHAGSVFAKTMKTVLGLQVELSDKNVAAAIATWIKSNVNLIVTIPDDYFDSIQHSVRKGFASGTRHEDIAREIEQDYLANGESAGMAKRRAALVARDQVQKLSSDINQKRQTAIGVERYVWRTSKDQRVRGSHREREGLTFRWDRDIETQLSELGLTIDPKIEGVPGYPINCRCYAEPVLSDLLRPKSEDNDEE